MENLHPFANACMNAASGALLLLGYWAIRSKRTWVHRRFMLGAFSVSAVFLASYAARFLLTGAHRYPVDDWTRTAYFVVLGTHSILATVLLPFVLRTVYLAWKERYPAHARLARWVFPAWVYVSATGVLVYWMLYHLGPSRL